MQHLTIHQMGLAVAGIAFGWCRVFFFFGVGGGFRGLRWVAGGGGGFGVGGCVCGSWYSQSGSNVWRYA